MKMGVNVCVEGGFHMPVKPLSYFCPVACGCRSGDAHCPDACPMRTPETPMCSDAQKYGASVFLGGDICPIADLRNYGERRALNSSTPVWA